MAVESQARDNNRLGADLVTAILPGIDTAALVNQSSAISEVWRPIDRTT